MATTRSCLRVIAVAGMLLVGVPAFQGGAFGQAPGQPTRDSFEARLRTYASVLAVGQAQQAQLATRQACLVQRIAGLERRNDQLETRLGALLRQIEALQPQIATHTTEAAEHRRQVAAEEATIRPLAAEEAYWNRQNELYLSWQRACENAWRGDWGASQVCRAGATAPGSRSFDAELTPARRRLQIAQDSLADAQRRLAASEAALQAAQRESAEATAEKNQVQPALAAGKAQLSQVSASSFQASDLLTEFDVRLRAAMRVDREDERPRTLHLLGAYGIRVLETTTSTVELIARMDTTYGAGWTARCD
jgi:chromosome segregation ATPase